MDREVAVRMCQVTWKIVLAAVSQLLARSSSEEIILHLLKVLITLYVPSASVSKGQRRLPVAKLC